MRIVLFDQINETHVTVSLARALERLGHEVISTGPVWKGHRFPESASDQSQIEIRLSEIISQRPDALFNFRASSLTQQHLHQLVAAGIRTMVWLPDDPVLYDVTYRHVVDKYDVTLNCGNQKILQFYSYQGHRGGVNFPFWLDTALYRPVYDPRKTDNKVVFFGNMHGPAKQGRYELLCGLHENLTIHGKVPYDPHAKCGGQLDSLEACVSTLSTYRIGLNVAQSFSDYYGSAYDYSGLAMLGHFFLPSRVIQYSAIGLPVLTIQEGELGSAHYPAGFHVRSAAEARQLIKRLMPQTELLTAVSQTARIEIEQRFAADKRAKLIEQLLSGSIDATKLTLHEREFIYQWM
jgi:hypothetical protein